MSVASEITRLQNAKADLKTAIEGKGESYYVDSLNDGNHTLSKQGSPVKYQGKFMTVSIKKSGNDYVFYCMED